MTGCGNRALARIATALAAAGAAMPAVAQPYDGMGMWHGNWGWGHMAAGGLLMLLFWGGVIVMLVLLVRAFGGGGARQDGMRPPGSTALEVLEERFARGEIDQQEFAERRRILLAGRAEGWRKAR
jgi:putative membrane protein